MCVVMHLFLLKFSAFFNLIPTRNLAVSWTNLYTRALALSPFTHFTRCQIEVCPKKRLPHETKLQLEFDYCILY